MTEINSYCTIILLLDGFNENLQKAFSSIKEQTEITDYTNLTSWNVEVINLTLVDHLSEVYNTSITI